MLVLLHCCWSAPLRSALCHSVAHFFYSFPLRNSLVQFYRWNSLLTFKLVANFKRIRGAYVMVSECVCCLYYNSHCVLFVLRIKSDFHTKWGLNFCKRKASTTWHTWGSHNGLFKCISISLHIQIEIVSAIASLNSLTFTC